MSRSRVELTRVRRLADSVAATLDGIDEHLGDVAGAGASAGPPPLGELAARLGEAAPPRRHDRARAGGGTGQGPPGRARRGRDPHAPGGGRSTALRREHDCEPDVAVAAECPPAARGHEPPTRAREIERELRLIGPVNPLAVEELAALQERDDHSLTTELDDVNDHPPASLSRVIRSIEAEMTTLLVAAYADVAENFAPAVRDPVPGRRRDG